ncbi:MAG: nitrogenase component 1 [Clostridiaceae bacterium]
MLKIVNGKQDEAGAGILIKDAKFPSPFVSGLEYSPPARGAWNIVHTGMLIPKSHQIFICTQGCLRGVVLTAAEMNAANRFSTIAVRENNVLDGDMESLIIDGVTDILSKLKAKPRAILIFTSCIHHFMGCDLKLVYRTLRERFPDIDFTDCYMNPIMRKSGMTPDQKMRQQLYSLLKPVSVHKKCINIIGNNLPTEESSELVRMIIENGFELKDITGCKTYEQYLSMAESAANISYNPVARISGDTLQTRLSQKHLYLPLSYDYAEIESNLNQLAAYLHIKTPDFTEEKAKAEKALKSAKEIIGDTPIAIDYTATMRPMGLARLLIEHGFNVAAVYADTINEEERQDFIWLKENSPIMKLYSTVHVKMRFLSQNSHKKLLAIGQKAAYFTGTSYFVNIVEGGGMYGFDGIYRLMQLMEEAFLREKDTKSLIQVKGLGCCSL